MTIKRSILWPHFCIVCNQEIDSEKPFMTCFWIIPEEQREIIYLMCTVCFDELAELREKQRSDYLENFIEKKLDGLMKEIPHQKISQHPKTTNNIETILKNLKSIPKDYRPRRKKR